MHFISLRSPVPFLVALLLPGTVHSLLRAPPARPDSLFHPPLTLHISLSLLPTATLSRSLSSSSFSKNQSSCPLVQQTAYMSLWTVCGVDKCIKTSGVSSSLKRKEDDRAGGEGWMEGSGGHTKECKVRTTTSANPLLAAAPPFRASSGLILDNLTPPPPRSSSSSSPPPPSSISFLLCRRLQRIIIQGALSSPSLNCFPALSLFLSPLTFRHSASCSSSPDSILLSLAFWDPRTPSTHPDHLLKRPNDSERVFPFTFGRHSSRFPTSGHSSGAEFHAYARDHPTIVFDIKGDRTALRVSGYRGARGRASRLFFQE